MSAMDTARDRILTAALELFSSRGYSAAGTRAVAKAAKVNEVTIFRIFGSKAALFEAVHSAYFIKPAAVLELVPTSEDLAADLSALGASFASLFERNHKLVAMSIRDIREEFAEIDRELKGQSATLASFAERRIAARRPDRAKDLARLFSDAVAGFALHRAMTGAIEWLVDDTAAVAAMMARGVTDLL